MTKDKRIEIRISAGLRKAFRRAAKQEKKTVSEVLTDFIAKFSNSK